MITKDELKKEVDKIPDSLLGEAYALLKKVNQSKNKENRDPTRWSSWKKNLENF